MQNNYLHHWCFQGLLGALGLEDSSTHKFVMMYKYKLLGCEST